MLNPQTIKIKNIKNEYNNINTKPFKRRRMAY